MLSFFYFLNLTFLQIYDIIVVEVEIYRKGSGKVSRIFVTGDLHGQIDIRKLNKRNFPIQEELTKEDYLIIVGDFGLVWHDTKRSSTGLNGLVHAISPPSLLTVIMKTLID